MTWQEELRIVAEGIAAYTDNPIIANEIVSTTYTALLKAVELGRQLEREELTSLEQQLVAECEKLITAIRTDCDNAKVIAGEVEDFIVNNCGEED